MIGSNILIVSLKMNDLAEKHSVPDFKLNWILGTVIIAYKIKNCKKKELLMTIKIIFDWCGLIRWIKKNKIKCLNIIFFEVIARHFKWLDWSVELRSKNYVFWDWFLFLF